MTEGGINPVIGIIATVLALVAIAIPLVGVLRRGRVQSDRKDPPPELPGVAPIVDVGTKHIDGRPPTENERREKAGLPLAPPPPPKHVAACGREWKPDHECDRDPEHTGPCRCMCGQEYSLTLSENPDV